MIKPKIIVKIDKHIKEFINKDGTLREYKNIKDVVGGNQYQFKGTEESNGRSETV